MKYTKLGNSDLTVSRICMGCMGFGDATRGQHTWTLDEEHSRQIIKRGLELGINFFDTAIAYQSGTSEQYVGCKGLCKAGERGDCNEIPSTDTGGRGKGNYRTAAYRADDR